MIATSENSARFSLSEVSGGGGGPVGGGGAWLAASSRRNRFCPEQAKTN